MKHEIHEEIDRSKHRPKRSAAQMAADLLFMEEQVLRGTSQARIAELLSAKRPYSLSKQQIQKDLAKLERRWVAAADELCGVEKARMLKALNAQEVQLWDAWHESKKDTVRKSIDSIGDASDLQTIEGAPPPAGRVRRTIVTETHCGEAAYMGLILKIKERRAKLLGLDAPTRQELSGPEGNAVRLANVSLSDEAQESILRRHYERYQRMKVVSDDQTMNSQLPLN